MDSGIKVYVSNYDSYQQVPSRLDYLYDEVQQVPVLRVYGAILVNSDSEDNSLRSDARDKKQAVNILVHIHNCLPYLYIDCFESERWVHDKRNIDKLVSYIEDEMCESFKKKPEVQENEKIDLEFPSVPNSQKRKFVGSVSVCKGIPMCGFQVGSSLFYKISLLSPSRKIRLMNLIKEGAINISAKFFGVPAKEQYKCYEAHLPFAMQVFGDYNIFSCSWLSLNSFYFRAPLINKKNIGAECDGLNDFVSKFINKCCVLDPGKYPRISKNTLEIDITSSEILNRAQVVERRIHEGFPENPTSRGFYLSSLRPLHANLKRECSLKNSSLSISQFKIEKNNYTAMCWENEKYLSESFEYMKKLNKLTKLHDLSEFSRYFLKRNLYETIPTAYELVDIERKRFLKPEISSNEFVQNIEELRTAINYVHAESAPRLQVVSAVDRRFFNDQQFFSADENEYTSDIKDKNNYSSNPLSPHGEVFDEDLKTKERNIFSTWEHIKEDRFPCEVNETQNPQDIISNNNESSKFETDEETYVIYSQKSRKKRRIKQTENFLSDLSSEIREENSLTQAHSTHDFLRNYALECAYESEIPSYLSKELIMKTFESSLMLKIDYEDPYFDTKSDYSCKLKNSIRKSMTKYLSEESLPSLLIEPNSKSMSDAIKSELRTSIPNKELCHKSNIWEYAIPPPMKTEVSRIIDNLNKSDIFQTQDLSIMERFKSAESSSNLKATKDLDAFNRLSYFHLEVFAARFDQKLPDPTRDPVSIIFYHFEDSFNTLGALPRTGVLFSINNQFPHDLKGYICKSMNEHIEFFANEKDMIKKLLFLVEYFDPDIISGYEVNALSWGYLIERFLKIYNMNLLFHLSRCVFKSEGRYGDKWGSAHTSGLEIVGRYVFNIWRVIRSEISIVDYSLENVVLHILGETLPNFSNFILSEWLSSFDYKNTIFVLHYFLKRINKIVQIIDLKELILKNTEQSNIIGIDFHSIFNRGSQFKVESILSRIAKTENILLDSVSKEEVHKMKPLECIPLVMEPDAQFYKSPLVVLDFQSLYPSIMIAFNYCYSTILGRITGYSAKENSVGYLKNLKLAPGLIDVLHKNKQLFISPNGCVFVKPSIRKSVLAKMLDEILNTRRFVKAAMNLFNSNTEAYKLYNSKQLALKLIANVTYGYTSATFSGRMPNSDLADAIVSTARDILTKSMKMINESEYGAKVVYGDTDSLFVYLPGRSRKEAFEIGNKLTKTISESFPDPITLKLEKVYHPCILLSKKRYVGYSFESADQKEPIFDSKGIETVRRDGIPAQSKLVRRSLEILFDTKNVSEVRRYVQRYFSKMINNEEPIGDFCFAKEVRLGTYKSEVSMPAGALVATRAAARDSRRQPQYRERVPYVVYSDPSKTRIKDRCVSPEDFVASLIHTPLTLDYEYYIKNVLLPPLNRFFILIGIDVTSWYKELSVQKVGSKLRENDILSISNFLRKNECLYCKSELSQNAAGSLCDDCISNQSICVADFISRENTLNSKLRLLDKKCKNCNNITAIHNTASFMNGLYTNCINRSCPIYYDRIKKLSDRDRTTSIFDNIMSSLN